MDLAANLLEYRPHLSRPFVNQISVSRIVIPHLVFVHGIFGVRHALSIPAATSLERFDALQPDIEVGVQLLPSFAQPDPDLLDRVCGRCERFGQDGACRMRYERRPRGIAERDAFDVGQPAFAQGAPVWASPAVSSIVLFLRTIATS